MATASTVPALLGGLAIGASATTNVVVFGRVLGASGHVSRVLTGKRLVDVGVLLGLILSGYIGQPVFVPPSAASAGIVRLVIAGALVGIGTTLGNGCTSGHGVCGVARGSKRSLVAVATFMGFASIVSQLSGTAGALLSAGAQYERTAEATMKNAEVVFGLSLYVLAAVLLVSRLLAKSEAGRAFAPLALQLCIGLSFGGGLLISGMALPLKVASFFAFGTETWDPAMGIVCASAIMLAAIGFFFKKKSTFLGTDLDLPPRDGSIDKNLLIGSALFGTGWAVGGICPGPAFVATGGAMRLASRGSFELAYNVSAFMLPFLICTYVTAILASGKSLRPSWTKLSSSKSKRSRSAAGKRGSIRGKKAMGKGKQ